MTSTITKTPRDFQSGLCEFMISFQNITFTDQDGNKIRKPDLYQAIYDNHIAVSPNAEFTLSKDVTYQLLLKNNHPSIRSSARKVVDWNETEALADACNEVFRRRAIVFVRDRIKSESVSVMDAVKLVAGGMQQAYENHSDIDSEVESKLKVS